MRDQFKCNLLLLQALEWFFLVQSHLLPDLWYIIHLTIYTSSAIDYTFDTEMWLLTSFPGLDSLSLLLLCWSWRCFKINGDLWEDVSELIVICSLGKAGMSTANWSKRHVTTVFACEARIGGKFLDKARREHSKHSQIFSHVVINCCQNHLSGYRSNIGLKIGENIGRLQHLTQEIRKERQNWITERLRPERAVKWRRNGAEEIKHQRFSTWQGLLAAFGQKPSDSQYGIEMRTWNAWGSGQKQVKLWTPVANPRKSIRELLRILRDQTAQLDQCLHHREEEI